MLKKLNGFKIVGINLLAFVIYAIPILIFGKGFDAISGVGFLFFIHFIFCLCAALDTKNWYWVLSGLIILTIGFSVCGYIIIIPSHITPK